MISMLAPAAQMIYPLETSDPFHFLQIFSSAQTQRLGFAHNFGVAMSWGNKIHVMSHFFSKQHGTVWLRGERE